MEWFMRVFDLLWNGRLCLVVISCWVVMICVVFFVVDLVKWLIVFLICEKVIWLFIWCMELDVIVDLNCFKKKVMRKSILSLSFMVVWGFLCLLLKLILYRSILVEWKWFWGWFVLEVKFGCVRNRWLSELFMILLLRCLRYRWFVFCD